MSKKQVCVCGHLINDHLENSGELVIAGECVECDCELYDEVGE